MLDHLLRKTLALESYRDYPKTLSIPRYASHRLTVSIRFGYAYILRNFVPHLKRHGTGDDQTMAMLVAIPQRDFDVA